MGIFDEVLRSDQTLIKNESALDYEFIPKLLPHREAQQKQIATAIMPMLRGRTGRNVLMMGAPGIGKTAATKHVLRDLEEEVDEEIQIIYINCWKKNTTYKVLLDLCEQIGFRFTHNKKTTDLYKVISSILNKSSAVLVFDEVDKAEDYDFLYFLLEEIFKKSIVVITNMENFLSEMDTRIKSRLTPEVIEFKAYDLKETNDIIRTRIGYSFYDGVWDEASIKMVVKKTHDIKDIRSGIFLLKESAMQAEERSSKEIKLKDVEKAVAKLDEFTVKNKEELEDDSKFILDVVKSNSGLKIGDLYTKYQAKGGKAVYKTFQRKIKKLEEGKFITTQKQTGEGGNTTIVSKKITDY
ncbi:Cdc6/Cdc18 family protein [Nanoarchaeota archaeon]